MSLQQRMIRKKAYRSLALRFQPDKNQHSQVSDATKMINETKEELEKTLRHNDAIREEERVRMAHNTIIISSESSSSYDSLETSYVESSGSGRKQIQTKSVISSNKSSTFLAKHKSDNEETLLKTHQGSYSIPRWDNLPS